MSTYSAFFASGLLAPHHRETTPIPPSSPLLPSDIDIGVDIDRTPTPTPSTAVPRTAHPDNTNNVDRPRLRKRRSSLTVAVSPFNGIKSPSRNAGAALQRHAHAMSVAVPPSRSRSGSVTGDAFGGGAATQENSLMGRLRSGSVGNGIRSRRALRGTPAAPPPTAPLPALPALPRVPPPSAPASIQSFQKRPPLAHRLRSVDNVLVPGYPTKLTVAMTTSEMSPVDPEMYSFENGYRIDEDMKEN